MTDLSQLDALSRRVNTDAAAVEMDQFRTDFKAVWRTWREQGEISEAEMAEGFAEASAAIRANRANPEWMRCAMDHFRQMTLRNERDQSRAERIRAEVKAQKEAAR
jgi:hypothetical protein